MGAPKPLKDNHQKVRKLNGVVVRRVLYNGRAVGHGKYFTGDVDGVMIVDDNGKPVPINQIGNLE